MTPETQGVAKVTKIGNKVFKLPRVGQRRRPQQVVCIAYPNRRRRRIFTPRKVGQIVCQMLVERREPDEIGFDKASLRSELRRELDRCFPCGDGDQKQQSAVREAVAVAQKTLQDNATVIAIALSVLAALLVLPRLIATFPRVVLTLIPFAAREAITRIPGLVAQLGVRQAANASMFRRIVGL